jgi:hypothetical protein
MRFLTKIACVSVEVKTISTYDCNRVALSHAANNNTNLYVESSDKEKYILF